MKRCSRCGVMKSEEGFTPKMARCKACRSEVHRERRALGLGQATDRARYRKSLRERQLHAARSQRWAARNRHKATAGLRVLRAIKRGVLVRQPCEVCGAKGLAHHDDYTKPLEVRWLCPLHHARHHAAEARRRVS